MIGIAHEHRYHICMNRLGINQSRVNHPVLRHEMRTGIKLTEYGEDVQEEAELSTHQIASGTLLHLRPLATTKISTDPFPQKSAAPLQSSSQNTDPAHSRLAEIIRHLNIVPGGFYATSDNNTLGAPIDMEIE